MRFQHVSKTAGALAALLDTEVTGVVNIASGTTRPVRDVIEALDATIAWWRDRLRS